MKKIDCILKANAPLAHVIFFVLSPLLLFVILAPPQFYSAVKRNFNKKKHSLPHISMYLLAQSHAILYFTITNRRLLQSYTSTISSILDISSSKNQHIFIKHVISKEFFSRFMFYFIIFVWKRDNLFSFLTTEVWKWRSISLSFLTHAFSHTCVHSLINSLVRLIAVFVPHSIFLFFYKHLSHLGQARVIVNAKET